MFELIFLGVLLLMGGVLTIKILLFLLGLIFVSAGFLFKFLFTLVFGIFLFPLVALVFGTVFSGGFLLFILLLTGLLTLLSEKRPREKY